MVDEPRDIDLDVASQLQSGKSYEERLSDLEVIVSALQNDVNYLLKTSKANQKITDDLVDVVQEIVGTLQKIHFS